MKDVLQVRKSTQIENITHVIFSLIAEPVTEIAGGPDLFINKDSTINLTCYVTHAPEPPSTIIWSHNHQVSDLTIREWGSYYRLKISCHRVMKGAFNRDPFEFHKRRWFCGTGRRYRYKQKHFSCFSRFLKKSLQLRASIGLARISIIVDSFRFFDRAIFMEDVNSDFLNEMMYFHSSDVKTVIKKFETIPLLIRDITQLFSL